MTLTVGRAGNLIVTGKPTRRGDLITLKGYVEEASAAQLAAREQQIRGLTANRDELLVPVTWTVNSEIDGFYRVTSAGFTPQAFEGGPIGLFELQLDRIGGGYAKPRFEDVGILAQIPGDFTVSYQGGDDPGDLSLTVGGVSTVYGEVYETPFETSPWFWSESGVVQRIHPYATGTVDGVEWSVEWYASAGSYYDDSVVLERLIDGTWYPIVGRQIPQIGTNWRISNGLIRVWFADNATMVVESFDGRASSGSAQWVEVARLNSDEGPGAGIHTTVAGTTSDPVVLRNGPEAVVVTVNYNGRLERRFSLHRGCPFVHIQFSNYLSVGLLLDTPAAVTAITRADVESTGSNDIGFTTTPVSDNAAVVVCPYSPTVNTTNGVVDLASASSPIFAVGVTPFATDDGNGGLDFITYSPEAIALSGLFASSVLSRVSAR